MQAPAWQESLCVHALLSLQGVPSATGAPVQTPAWQTSWVQTFPPGSSGQAVPVSGV